VGRSDGGGTDVESHAKFPLSFKLLAGERVVEYAVKVEASVQNVPLASEEDRCFDAKTRMGEVRDTTGAVAFPGSRDVAAVGQVLRSIESACQLGRIYDFNPPPPNIPSRPAAHPAGPFMYESSVWVHLESTLPSFLTQRYIWSLG